MSETDSFINEVTEEVRRDKLFFYIRKYGWIAVLVVVALVGGAAYNEYRKAVVTAEAQATGDALIAALTQNDTQARADGLAAIAATGDAAGVIALLGAATQLEADDAAGAVATLNSLATNPDVPQIYRDVAGFKALMIRLPEEDIAARRQSLEALAQPGAPFSLLAQEQIAFMDIEAGNTEAAIAQLRRIVEDAGVTRGLSERAQTLLVALGDDFAPSTNDAAAADPAPSE